MPDTQKPVNPFSTGGGGYQFELLVAVYYLVQLLRQETSRGISGGIVQEVRLQQRVRNCPLDDVVVQCQAPVGSRVLYLQVRHQITFSLNNQFRDVIAQAWWQFSKNAFNKNRDVLGLAIGNACDNRTVRTHVRDVLHWSRTSSDANGYYEKVEKFTTKKRVLRAFEAGLASALQRKPNRDQVWHFLKHFDVVAFDFGSDSGRDGVDSFNQLLTSVEPRDPRHAKALLAILYKMAAEYATQGGEITRDALARWIAASTDFAVPILHRAGGGISEILSRRLSNRITAEKNSKKYISEVFVEVGRAKDMARLFCHPVLFLRKLEEDIRGIDLFGMNRMLQSVGLQSVTVDLPQQGMGSDGFGTVEAHVRRLQGALRQLTAHLSVLKREESCALRSRVPRDRRRAFDEVSHRISDAARAIIDFEISQLSDFTNVARARVLGIVCRAGQGKTNFVCDLAERCLAKRRIPCAFFTGKELGRVGRHELCSFVARSVYGPDNLGTIDMLLTDIDEEAARRSSAGVVIIDALNEHENIPTFAQEVEEFIEKCLHYPHIRVIFTCRSEYFNARFGNLNLSSFANLMVIEEEIHRHMSDEHRHHMVDGHLRFFKIQLAWMAKHVSDQFTNDPFFLRVFCEAYGNPKADRPRSLPALRNIRREALFRTYLNRKLGALKSRSSLKTGFLVGTAHPYQKLLRVLVEWMLNNRQFADVPTSALPEVELGVLSDMIDEDVLIRRDLAARRGVLDDSAEVINFTFDAFRDFLLSDHLLNTVLPSDQDRCRKTIDELTQAHSTVAEGLREYLFYACRHCRAESARQIVEAQPWYDEIFVPCVFGLEDEAMTPEDMHKLRHTCLAGDDRAPEVIYSLLVRWDTTQDKYANISMLFEIFDCLDDNAFQDLCERTFGAARYGAGKGYYFIDKLVDDIRRAILTEKSRWFSEMGNLATLLLYLWNVPDAQRCFPARELFSDFANARPRVARRLTRDHLRNNRKGCREDVSWLFSGRA